MTKKQRQSRSACSLVDPMATWDHLVGLGEVINQANVLMGQLHDKLSKKDVKRLSQKEVEELSKLYVSFFSGEAELLDEYAFRERVEKIMGGGLVLRTVPIEATLNYLFGLAVALKMRPIPKVGQDFFYNEGIAES